MSEVSYDTTFFDYIERGSRRSAEIVASELCKVLGPRSVLDVGCGRGTWLVVWQSLGVSDIMGLDGSYLSLSSLVIPGERYRAVDLSQPVDIGRRFDLAQSLEVAEHLPASSAQAFISTLTRHADLVLFSAARPGQGGEHHLNERPYEYWRGLFRMHGYEAYDIRPLIDDPAVEPWYRYNTLLFVSQRAASTLPPSLRMMHVPDGSPIVDVAPIWWRLRCVLLGMLPAPLVNRLAVLKHHAVLGGRLITSHLPR